MGSISGLAGSGFSRTSGRITAEPWCQDKKVVLTKTNALLFISARGVCKVAAAQSCTHDLGLRGVELSSPPSVEAFQVRRMSDKKDGARRVGYCAAASRNDVRQTGLQASMLSVSRLEVCLPMQHHIRVIFLGAKADPVSLFARIAG
eukprot:1161622-Pelagomonas_calceolata.AAC.9